MTKAGTASGAARTTVNDAPGGQVGALDQPGAADPERDGRPGTPEHDEQHGVDEQPAHARAASTVSATVPTPTWTTTDTT